MSRDSYSDMQAMLASEWERSKRLEREVAQWKRQYEEADERAKLLQARIDGMLSVIEATGAGGGQ